RGTGLEDVAAGADYIEFVISGVNTGFHFSGEPFGNSILPQIQTPVCSREHTGVQVANELKPEAKFLTATKQPVHRNISSLTDGGAAALGTVSSEVGHLARSTTINHYFWTTSFFSDRDIYKLNPLLRFVKSVLLTF
ncbi:MAG TPA: hypothetical protein VGL72_09730, partial [Bryobacteraceae bacterium]